MRACKFASIFKSFFGVVYSDEMIFPQTFANLARLYFRYFITFPKNVYMHDSEMLQIDLVLLAEVKSKYKTKVIPNKVCIIRLYTIKYCIFRVI